MVLRNLSVEPLAFEKPCSSLCGRTIYLQPIAVKDFRVRAESVQFARQSQGEYRDGCGLSQPKVAALGYFFVSVRQPSQPVAYRRPSSVEVEARLASGAADRYRSHHFNS